MARYPAEFALDSLPERLVRRAALLIETEGDRSVVLDADRNEFARLPELADGTVVGSLSHDGTHLILVARSGSGVGVRALGGGEPRWFDGPDPEYEHDRHATSSPDGTTIAVLSGDDGDEPGTAVVSLLDPASGARRRLWSAVGAASWECGLCWSPDGRLLAVTYMIWDDERDDDALSTVVLDPATGQVLASYPIATIAAATYATWANDHELLYRHEYDDVNRRFVADPRTGTVWTTPELTGRLWGVVGGRHLHEVAAYEEPTASHSAFYTTNLDGTARRSFFGYHPKTNVGRVHLAPGAFPDLATR
ncbi:TolB family protein [Streptosporangium sp. NPDC000095]|uniref:TolB family protein n=1 Tax=Streptosporangium sp. NPDC000095 TaxID=3366184 RepID=UPI0036870B6F